MIRYLVLLLLVSCGQSYREYDCGVKGDNCEKTDKDSSNKSGDDDGNIKYISGPRGPRGVSGETGSQGIPGDAGQAGADGAGCTVTAAVNGALITCPTGSVLVLNGNNGTDGLDGQNGQDGQDAPPSSYSVVELIDPCGDKPGVYDEVFLRLQNGMLIASFSDNMSGYNTRFSVLVAGSYQTTDGSACFFSVDSNLNIYNEHY